MSALVIGPAISLALMAAHEGGLATHLGELSRFVLPAEDQRAPAESALHAEPPLIKARRSIESGVLAGGNLDQPVVVEQPISDILPKGALSQLAAKGADDSSARPLAAASRHADPRLRERYLLRAWMESASEFHAKRADGKSLLVYRPEEGYTVLAAAYNPAIQPVKPPEEVDDPAEPPVYGAGGDRGTVYREPDEPQQVPGWDPPLPTRTTEIERPSAKRARRDQRDPRARSFQPWDSEVMSDPFGPANALVSRVPGLRIEQVTLYQGFSSNGYPLGSGGGGFSPFNSNLGYDLDFGATATISWMRTRPTGSLFLRYTPTHIRRMNFSEWNSTDHRLSLGATKRYARWSMSMDTGAAVSGLPQVLFSPAVTRTVENVPSSFDDLVEAAGNGQYSNDELASALTGAPVVESQPRTEFARGRVLSSTAGARVSRSHSARLSSNFNIGVSRFQTISQPEASGNARGLLDLFRSSSIGGGGGLSYRLSPETSVGLNSDLRRNYSNFRDATSVNTSASLDRRMGRRWSMRASGGVGNVFGINIHRSGAGLGDLSPGAVYSTWIASGSLQYSGRTHSFSADASRFAGDSVGLGATASYRAGANWAFSRPGSAWGLNAGANWYQMTVDGLARGTQGTFVGGGLVRRLSRETAFQANYSYQVFDSPFQGVVSNLSGHRVQMSWVWRPAGAPR